MFKTNHKDTGDRMLKEPGEYECVVNDLYQAVSNGGTDYLSLDLLIRRDVEQKYGGGHIFESLWLSEKALPITQRRLNALSKALELPEKEYESYDEFGSEIKGMPVRVKLYIREGTNGYADREAVAAFMTTRYPAMLAEDKPAPKVKAGGFTEITTDEELPF